MKCYTVATKSRMEAYSYTANICSIRSRKFLDQTIPLFFLVSNKFGSNMWNWINLWTDLSCVFNDTNIASSLFHVISFFKSVYNLYSHTKTKEMYRRVELLLKV